VLNEYNTVFASKRSAIRPQAVYFLHLTMPSVMCLRLSDVSIICHITYFQFPIQSVFFHISVARQDALQHIAFNMQYWTSDVAENFSRYLSCTKCTVQRKDFALILTVINLAPCKTDGRIFTTDVSAKLNVT